MSSSFSNVRYRMVSAKDDDTRVASNELTSEDPSQSEVGKIKWKKLFRREEFVFSMTVPRSVLGADIPQISWFTVIQSRSIHSPGPLWHTQ
jgi:hypothetical protein